jgi:transposase
MIFIYIVILLSILKIFTYLSILMKHINAYPLIYKTIVCDYYFANKGNQKITDILKLFKISNGTLYNWVNAYKTNNLTEKIKYNKTSKYTLEIKQYIKNYVLKIKNFDYRKLIKNIKNKFSITVSKTMIYDILNMLKITRKKFNKRIIPDKKKLNSKIKKFKKELRTISKDDIICIDETGIDTHQTANYGWNIKG